MEKHVQKSNEEIIRTPLQPQSEQLIQESHQMQHMVWDQRSPGQYLIDKTFELTNKHLQCLEKEKPGTRRKLAGITSLGAGVTSICFGIYFLTS